MNIKLAWHFGLGAMLLFAGAYNVMAGELFDDNTFGVNLGLLNPSGKTSDSVKSGQLFGVTMSAEEDSRYWANTTMYGELNHIGLPKKSAILGTDLSFWALSAVSQISLLKKKSVSTPFVSVGFGLTLIPGQEDNMATQQNEAVDSMKIGMNWLVGCGYTWKLEHWHFGPEFRYQNYGLGVASYGLIMKVTYGKYL